MKRISKFFPRLSESVSEYQLHRRKTNDRSLMIVSMKEGEKWEETSRKHFVYHQKSQILMRIVASVKVKDYN